VSASPLGSPPPDAAAESWTEGPGLLASLWRYRLLVLGATLLAAALGYLLASQRPVSYEASAQVFLSNPRRAAVFSDFQPNLETAEYTAQQVSLFNSRTVADRASALLGGRLTPEEVDEHLEVEIVEAGALLLDVTAVADTADEAVEIANAGVQAYSQVASESTLRRAQEAAAQLDPQRQDYQQRINELQRQLAADPDSTVLQSQIEALNGQLLELESRAQQLLVNAGAFGDGIDVAEPAVVGGGSLLPPTIRDTVLFAVLGACIGGALAYWRAGRARGTATREDPAQILGAPLLGEIPNYRTPDRDTLSGQLALDPRLTESYQFVLASIEYALEEIGASSLLVTSARPGDGKTTTALQLALAASRDGRRVVLVDTDIRVQGLTTMIGVENRTGLTELALQDLDVDESVHYLPVTDEVLLPVVAAGNEVPDPGSFFRATSFRKALQRIKDEAELVMLDSSPLLAVADTSVIAGQVGGVVVVVDHGTPLEQLRLLRDRLSFVSTPLLGYVYNRSDSPGLAAYGYGKMPKRKASGEPITLVPPRASRD
jgi:capsular exopolysaccharide synthesis family protein